MRSVARIVPVRPVNVLLLLVFRTAPEAPAAETAAGGGGAAAPCSRRNGRRRQPRPRGSAPKHRIHQPDIQRGGGSSSGGHHQHGHDGPACGAPGRVAEARARRRLHRRLWHDRVGGGCSVCQASGARPRSGRRGREGHAGLRGSAGQGRCRGGPGPEPSGRRGRIDDRLRCQPPVGHLWGRLDLANVLVRVAPSGRAIWPR